MRSVLSKRIPRDLKKNWLKYLGMLVILVCTIAVGSSYSTVTNGRPMTAHTTNLVPFCINRTDIELLKEGGKLGNIAPTIIDLLGKEKPAEMTEESLIIHK